MATQNEGLVVALTAALADKKDRLDAATSAGINMAPLKRQIAMIEADLAMAKRQAAVELHALPGVAALTLQVEQLQSDLATAKSTIERLQAAPAA